MSDNRNSWQLLDGVDRRVSISKFLWLTWIVAIFCCYTISFVLHARAKDYSIDSPIPVNLLIVYCLIASTAAADKAITNAHIRGNRLWLATPADSPGGRVPGNLFRDEFGRLDLAKVQMMSFTLAAAGIFVGTFGRQVVSSPSAAAPVDLSTSLVILIGVSQASYLSRKSVTAASSARDATRSPWAVAGPGVWLITVGITLEFAQSFGTDFIKSAAQLLLWFEVPALILFNFTGLVPGSQVLVRYGRSLAGVIFGFIRDRIDQYTQRSEAGPSPADGKETLSRSSRSSVIPSRIGSETWSVIGPAAHPMADAGFLTQVRTGWRPRVRQAAAAAVWLAAAVAVGAVVAIDSGVVISGAAVSLGVLTVSLVALQGEAPVSLGRLRRQSGAQAGDVWEQAVDVVEAESATGRLVVCPRPGDTPAATSVLAEDRVNVGVIRASRPGTPIIKGPLAAGEDHLVWVGIGPSDLEAAPGDGHPLNLPKVDLGQSLDVVLFPDDALLVPDAPRTGSFVMSTDRPLRVRKPAERPLVSEMLAATRLYFRIRTPAQSGDYTVRVCVYYRNALLQVRQVSLPVGRSPAQLFSITSYAIIRSPSAPGVTELAERRLSLYVNESGDGSHDLWVRAQDGQEDWHAAGHLNEGEVGRLIKVVRDRLREVSWGTTAEYSNEQSLYPAGESQSDRFDVTFEKLKSDLFVLAKGGYAAWELITDKIGRGHREELRERTRQPGIIEIAPRTSSNVIPPLAALYDIDLDTGAEESELSLCPVAEKALLEGSDLAETECFTDYCQAADGEVLVVCPSGFWGLRHNIAVPLPHEAGPDLEPRLRLGRDSVGAALIGTMPESVLPDITGHAMEVAGRFGKFDHVTGRKQWFDKAKKQKHYSVLYFLCHGKEGDWGSELVLGKLSQSGISRSNLKPMKVSLGHNPLVVMNACETGALAPDKAITLVGGFTSGGAGAVIGTEVTIFSELAYAFADAFMNAFVGTVPGQPTMVGIGAAVRTARLELLRKWNPLGLAYVLYGLADATLVAPALVAPSAEDSSSASAAYFKEG